MLISNKNYTRLTFLYGTQATIPSLPSCCRVVLQRTTRGRLGFPPCRYLPFLPSPYRHRGGHRASPARMPSKMAVRISSVCSHSDGFGCRGGDPGRRGDVAVVAGAARGKVMVGFLGWRRPQRGASLFRTKSEGRDHLLLNSLSPVCSGY